MTPHEVLDLIEQLLRTTAFPGHVVVRVPEGLAVLEIGGTHVLIRADRMTLEVIG